MKIEINVIGWQEITEEESKQLPYEDVLMAGLASDFQTVYFKRLPSPVAESVTTEKPCCDYCGLDKVLLLHTKANICQDCKNDMKDFAGENMDTRRYPTDTEMNRQAEAAKEMVAAVQGENMEEKKEVKWFDSYLKSELPFENGELSGEQAQQLFDAYHAQKAELKRVNELASYWKESCQDWRRILVETRKEFNQLLDQQPDRSDDGNLANEKRTAYHQQRRIPTPKAAEMPEKKSNAELALQVCDGNNFVQAFEKAFDLVDKKIQGAI